MRSLRLLITLTILYFLVVVPASAEKFSTTLDSDYSLPINTQNTPLIPQLPSRTSSAAMPQDTSADRAVSLPTASPSTAPATPIQTPSMGTSDIPSLGQPAPATQTPAFSGTAAPTIKSPFDVQGPKIKRTDYEAQYKKLQQKEAAEKAKKMKKLSESIEEEIKKYGLFFLFGLAAILLFYALRKEAPVPQTHVPEDKIPQETKDIWKEF